MPLCKWQLVTGPNLAGNAGLRIVRCKSALVLVRVLTLAPLSDRAVAPGRGPVATYGRARERKPASAEKPERRPDCLGGGRAREDHPGYSGRNCVIAAVLAVRGAALRCIRGACRLRDAASERHHSRDVRMGNEPLRVGWRGSLFHGVGPRG